MEARVELVCYGELHTKPRFWTDEERVLTAEVRKAGVKSEDTFLIPILLLAKRPEATDHQREHNWKRD